MKKTIEEETSKELVNNLAILIKTAQLHHVDNIAFINAIQKLLSILNPLSSSGEVSLELFGGIFYLNENRVRYSMEYSSNFDFLAEEFKKRGMGTIVFEKTMHEDDIKAFTLAFLTSGSSETPFETFSEELNMLPHIKVKMARKIKDDITEFEQKKLIKKSYSNAVSITEGALKKLEAGERINLKKSKRVVETIVDQIVEEESQSMLIGMTTIKDYDEYTYYHSVNVSILAMTLGHKLGLSRKTLADLGLAALLHDIGKVGVPLEILNKPSKFTDEEWEIMKFHPLWGAFQIFKTRDVDETSMILAISAFEHHLNYDNSGYPKLKKSLTLDLFSKIIAIADQYDAITASRVYSRTPRSPEKALSIMFEGSGTKLDHYLLKVFIRMVGIYPIGCLVMLDTNELGLVFENNSDSSNIDRPRVLVITDSSGVRVKDTMVNLMEKTNDGNYKRSIVKTLDPNQYGINLAEHLL